MKEKIFDISYRTNILHKDISINEVTIFEDHRTILNVLFHLRTKRNYTEPLDLIMFDKHDDFCDISPDAKRKITYFNKKPSYEKLSEIVEFHLSSLDDDWIKAGMELGFIGNVFLFNSTDTSASLKETYKTKQFGVKKLYNIGNIWAALGHHGILNDPYKTEYEELRADFGWKLENGTYRFREERRKYVFDIDLDCFTTEIYGETIAVPEDILVSKLNEIKKQHYHNYHSSQHFMSELIMDSEIVTISLESDCCGGIKQSQKILRILDTILFQNQLGTK